jgi:hypothetical protein
MSVARGRELPPDKARVYRTAVRIEWLTIAYMVSAVGLLYLTLGSSQAMKAAWWEDLLGLLPPIAFLLSDRFRDRDPTPRFPTDGLVNVRAAVADPVAKMEDAAERLRAIDWRIQEIVVTLVRQLDPWEATS